MIAHDLAAMIAHALFFLPCTPLIRKREVN
jgi:hypothetical protein